MSGLSWSSVAAVVSTSSSTSDVGGDVSSVARSTDSPTSRDSSLHGAVHGHEVDASVERRAPPRTHTSTTSTSDDFIVRTVQLLRDSNSEARIPQSRHRHRHRLARHAYILTSDTRDFLKLFLWQAERGSRPTRRQSSRGCRHVGVVECGLNEQ